MSATTKTEPTVPKVPEALLDKELAPAAPITFALDGVSYTLPRPLPVKAWVATLNALYGDNKLDADTPDEQWFIMAMSEQAVKVLTRLTGLDAEKLHGLGEAEHGRVMDLLVDQMGEELADASPFSVAAQARDTIRRALRLASAMTKAKAAGGQSSAGSNPTPAGADGGKFSA